MMNLQYCQQLGIYLSYYHYLKIILPECKITGKIYCQYDCDHNLCIVTSYLFLPFNVLKRTEYQFDKVNVSFLSHFRLILISISENGN